MTLSRKSLSQEEINSLAATALPFLVIWTEDNFVEFIMRAQRNDISGYLHTLGHYNTQRKYLGVTDAERIALLKEITSLEKLISHFQTSNATQTDLIAAAYNLLALLQLEVNTKAVAQNTLETALKLADLSPLSKASIHSNLAYIMMIATEGNDQTMTAAALDEAERALQSLQATELNNPIVKHIAAAIYNGVGDLYYKINKPGNATKAHAEALGLWPENPVIRKNTKDSVQALESILIKDYETQKTENRFNALLRLANVNIKLAGLAQCAENREEKDKYLLIAEDYIRQACIAIENDSGKEDYKKQAQIKFIKSRMYYVDGNVTQVQIMRELAGMNYAESKEIKPEIERFQAKFPVTDPTKPFSFNIQMLFSRYRQTAPAVVTEEKQSQGLTPA
jgi:tetratricopeptide (TPR) repeat protein